MRNAAAEGDKEIPASAEADRRVKEIPRESRSNLGGAFATLHSALKRDVVGTTKGLEGARRNPSQKTEPFGIATPEEANLPKSNEWGRKKQVGGDSL